jgi:hypothetical protein
MNDHLIWLLLILVAATFITIWNRNDLPLSSLLVLACVFSVGEVWLNYPMIWRDVLFHGSGVKSILETAHTGGTWLDYPSMHPGLFIVWSILALVTGLDIVRSNLVLLLPVGVMLVIGSLVVIHRKLGISIANGCALLAFLLMNFNMNEYMFSHFNTRLLSFAYVLVFLLLFLRRQREPAGDVLLLVISVALVISHPLNSLVVIVFLGIRVLLDPRQARFRSMFLSCATIYVVWNAYVGYERLAMGLLSLLDFYAVFLGLDVIAGWASGPGAAPFFGIVFGTVYKVLLVLLTLGSLYCALRLRSSGTVRTLTAYLLSTFAVYGIAFFFGLTWIAADRAIILASLPLASLPVILLIPTRSNHGLWRRRAALALVLILVIPQFALVHEPPLGTQRVASISDVSSFLVNHRGGRGLATLDDFPLYYCFYDPYYMDYDHLSFLELPSLGNVTDFLLTRSADELKVVGYRQIVDWGWVYRHAYSYDDALAQWDRAVNTKLNGRYNSIYSNGFETVYS